MKNSFHGTVFESAEELDSVHSGENSPEPKSGDGTSAASAGVSVGRLVGINAAGEPMVEFLSNAYGQAITARSIVALTKTDEGREVVLQFEEGDVRRPIVMGVIQRPEPPHTSERPPAAAEGIGERMILTAQKEIVLQCGAASITLTRSGKILLRGTYIVSRSSGMNRINGASVQIN
jgi:hypothetical protein